MQSRVLMHWFLEIKRPSLLRRLLAANAMDLFLDGSLTMVSTLMTFSAPFFLAYILRAMSPPANSAPVLSSPEDQTSISALIHQLLLSNPSSQLPISSPTVGSSRKLQRSDAYLFAIAAFLCQIIKTQTDLQHLYFARRAAVRMKGELVASVYEKALRRKDMAGAVQKETPGKGKGKRKADGGKKGGVVQEPSSADIGKIVSLVATDADRVARFVSFGQYLYDTPLSIIIACTMLYNLMGWTAFTGYIAILLALPINSALVRRMSARLRHLSILRDQRMRAMNEVIQGIKFLKFSAWETRWMRRILNAREAELEWLRGTKMNLFWMGMVWDVVPILVSAISFTCFTLVARRELTVDIAFPCITVFAMLGQSLGQASGGIIISRVALKRIENYLSEDEVPPEVSSLTRSTLPPHAPVDGRIGCIGATFRWTHEAVSKPDKSEVQVATGLVAKIKSAWGVLLLRLRLRKAVEPKEPEDEPEQREDRPFELKDVSVVFPEGVMSLVCGPTGSGKSSLLSALLGEMNKVTGQVYLPKEPTRLNEKTGLQTSISYCAQQPWLEHKSIKKNILFGSPFDEERYNLTLSCCALLPDLAIFEDGDETEIGEKGVSLSGGQKARVALARAVYSRSQVVLLDDVLSAVDAPTAEHLVQKCFLGSLMQNRTVVLVTHHVNLVLPFMSWVVKLNEGEIEAQGSIEHLRESGALTASRPEQQERRENEREPLIDAPVPAAKQAKSKARRLVDDEKKSTGNVKLAVYKAYVSAASYWLFGILVLFLAVDQVMQLLQKFWLKYWSESYETSPRTLTRFGGFFNLDLPSASQNVLPYLLIYVGIQGSISMLKILNQIPRVWSTLRASRVLYEKMLLSVVRSPSRFFDKTPSGRILNRFSKDIVTIDSGVQNFIVQVIVQAISLVIAVVTIVYAVPLFIVPAIVIAYIHLWFARGYITVTRDLTRIRANTHSPIVSSFGELVVGIATVRAFGAERIFLNNMYKFLDRTQAATHYYWMCNRWLLFRFDTLGALSVLIATSGSLMVGASAGLTGIVIVQAQQYTGSLYWGLRYWTELEQSFNSVERIQEYLELPSEPPTTIESNRPPAAWPSATKGSLVVKDLVIHYAPELPAILKGVSFETNPSEKIGIVGRTGSGKSTLALALFRFVDPSRGSITLDGIDITSIGLDDLRSRLTFIPQDVMLFSGTVRDNLDPFNEYTDAECIEVLQRVYLVATDFSDGTLPTSIKGLAKVVAPTTPTNRMTLPRGPAQQAASTLVASNAPPTSTVVVGAESNQIELTLDTKVSDGGNNFSHGQRQLISLARALLRRSNVIVMDESTASVDFEIDAKIQKTIRQEFSGSILLTIAHRLRTVIDNDRILVLDAGHVAEFDTPQNLLKMENGMFHEMCKKSGDYEELLEMANSTGSP
ncbi:P-loop containing nucleoside triphosphate hydrolase protein [Ceratobasidium sp. AG-I]|nr:P-loop containing nucleoside triphosphate hydrolase protein [Ceratobasidium sp. AG-I]